MKQVCKYHPGTRAHWYCPQDGIHLCDDCVGGDQHVGARSLLSNKAVQPLLSPLAATPFWQMLPWCLRQATHPQALLMLVLAALPAALFAGDAVLWSLLALPALVPIHYGALMMTAMANGRLQPLPVAELRDTSSLGFSLQHAALALPLVAVPLVLAQWLGPTAGFWPAQAALAVMLLLIAPLLIELLRDRQLTAALRGILRPVLLLGGTGLLAVLVAIVGAGGLLALTWVLADMLPAWLAGPVLAVLVGAGWLTLVAMLGFLACQWQDVLDLPTRQRQARERRMRARRPEDVRRQEVLLYEGRYDKVLSVLRNRLDKQPESLALNDDYMRLLQALGREQEVLAQAEDWLAAIIKAGQGYRLPEALRQLRDVEADYRPADPALSTSLAQALRDAGQPKAALWMLQDLHKRAPEWHGLAEAYLLLVRILALDLSLPAKAEPFLKFLENRFREPRHREQTRACRVEVGL